ncbi:hypothetical protein [Streptomyces sp. NPDC020681]|uniref:hypothetical protein n=1 Tax=Streptomyces sp. NPDC020681 TaxID=3365083 RepID=UPI00378DBD82
MSDSPGASDNTFNGPAPFQAGPHSTQNNFIYQEGQSTQAQLIEVETTMEEEWDVLRAMRRQKHPWNWSVIVHNRSLRPIFHIEVTFVNGVMETGYYKIWKRADRRLTEEWIWGPRYPNFGGQREIHALAVGWSLSASSQLALPPHCKEQLRAHPPQVDFTDDNGERWKIDHYGALRSLSH